MTNLKLKDILMLIILFIILFIIGYVILFFFGGAVLSALGLKYNSVISLAKFIAIYYIISLPVELIIFSFFKLLKKLKTYLHWSITAYSFLLIFP